MRMCDRVESWWWRLVDRWWPIVWKKRHRAYVEDSLRRYRALQTEYEERMASQRKVVTDLLPRFLEISTREDHTMDACHYLTVMIDSRLISRGMFYLPTHAEMMTDMIAADVAHRVKRELRSMNFGTIRQMTDRSHRQGHGVWATSPPEKEAADGPT